MGTPPAMAISHLPRAASGGAARTRMDAGKAAAMEHATGICNRLYNFFARHFAYQGTKLVTLGRRSRSGAPAPAPAAAAEDIHYPHHPATSASAAGMVRLIGRDVPIGDAAAAAEGRKANINERSDAFIRSRKEALRSETGVVRRRSPPRQ